MRSISGFVVVEKEMRYNTNHKQKHAIAVSRYFQCKYFLYFLYTKYPICSKLRITDKYNNRYIDIYYIDISSIYYV